MAFDKELEPILIAFVKQNRLQFSIETFRDILSKVGSRPVSVVSITHSNDEKKNQMFNECLDYLKTLEIDNNARKGFVWKCKAESDPKGIYLWPEPIIIKKSCQEAAVLLMEINGCFDTNTTQEDLTLFALNCVLSSTLICSIEKGFSEEHQKLFQLFCKYGRGGIGPELSDSFLNLVLMINNWKSPNHYPFGYHDISTCPPNGNKMFNYRKERLDTKLGPDKVLEEEVALKNQSFINCFQKISFCLMPGEDLQSIDQTSNLPKFGDIWRQIINRLFHPSTVSIKSLGNLKFNGHQLVRLFEQISALTTNTDLSETEEDFRARIKNVTALSISLDYYKLKMNKSVAAKIYFAESDLDKIHDQSMKKAKELFEGIRGMTDSDSNNFKGKFNNLFDSEVQNVRQMYEELNRFKFETLNGKQKTQRLVNDMAERVVQKWNGFSAKQTGLDIEISQLIGFGLEDLTSAVRSTIGTN